MRLFNVRRRAAPAPLTSTQVLYTHQKQKKHKTWQDGVLKVNDDGTRAALHSGSGAVAATFLEALLIRNGVRN